MATTATLPLTTFELVALLTFREGPSATQSALSLRLPDPATAVEARRAGLSSLVVRELVTVDGDQITPRGNAGGVSGVLTQADRWVEVGIVRRTSTDAAVLAGVADDAVLVSPRGFDVWDVLPVKPGTDLLDAGMDLARRGIASAPQDDAVSASVKVTTASGSTAASVHRDEEGVWRVATGPADAAGALTIHDETYPDVEAALSTARASLA